MICPHFCQEGSSQSIHLMTASQEDNFSHPFKLPVHCRKEHQQEEIPHRRGGGKGTSDGSETILWSWPGLKGLWRAARHLLEIAQIQGLTGAHQNRLSMDSGGCQISIPEEFLRYAGIMGFFLGIFFFGGGGVVVFSPPSWKWRVLFLWKENLQKDRLPGP